MKRKTTIRPRKQAWSIEQWTAFAVRCQGVRDRIDRFIREFPETRGLKASNLDRFVRAHDKMVRALMGIEYIVASEYPGYDHQVIRSAQGTYSTWVPVQGRVKSGTPPLSRAEWVRWGSEVKAIRADLRTLMMEFQEARGVTRPHLQRFIAVESALDRGRCYLDGLVHRQHPDWRDASRVFYEANPPAPTD